MATNIYVTNPYYVNDFEIFLNDCSVIVENALKLLPLTELIWMYETRNILQDHADNTPAFKTLWDFNHDNIFETVDDPETPGNELIQLTDGFVDSMNQLISERQ